MDKVCTEIRLFLGTESDLNLIKIEIFYREVIPCETVTEAFCAGGVKHGLYRVKRVDGVLLVSDIYTRVHTCSYLLIKSCCMFVVFHCLFQAIGRYESGKRRRVHWFRKEGGSFLVGPADAEGDRVHGLGCVYLYPNLEDAVVGEFARGKLLSGRHGRVAGVTFNYGIPVPVVAKSEDAPEISFDQSTSMSIR